MKPRMATKLLAVAILGLATACAQDDGPGRGVARLSLINGDVSVRRGDSGDWSAAAVNTPLVIQDSVVTGAASRAEVQFDWANMLRLASNTEVRMAELENRRYQVQVARGIVTLGVLRDSDAEIEVNTPQVSVRPVKRGLYRVMVREDGQTEVTVRSGEAEVYTPRGTERLNSGRTMLVRGTASEPEFQVVRAVSEDDWDRWNEDRNRQLERSRSYSYVSRDVYGADDLDAHGRWVYDAPYGYVWAPYGVGPYWAPYRHGRWVWIDWYGWSWLSYDPWGWAPFHYGRWYHHASWGWCWWPGYRHHRHYWRPGLVAFFGWGHHSGLGVGIGFGHIGWVPLAPYEPFHAWYGNRYYGGYRNRTYVDNSINIVNNVNITNVYRNARVTNGVTGIEAGDFGRGRGARAIRGSEVDFGRSNLMRGALPVTPTRDSLRFSDRTVQAGNLPRTTEPGRFYSRRPAANVERVPFEQQRQGMEQMVRRGLGGGGAEAAAGGNLPRTGSERTAARGESGNLSRIEAGGRVASARPETGNLPRSAEQPASGWRRLGEPARSPQGETRTESGRTGRSFGEPMTRPAAPEAGRQIERRAEEPIRRESNAGWTRFGGARQTESSPRMGAPESGSEARGLPRGTQESQGRSERRSGPEPRSESPRFGAPRDEGSRGSESIRISPPIVRERSAPRSESPRVESPRYQSPRYEAPRYESRPAPSPRYESRPSPTPRYESPRYESRPSPSPRYEGPRYESRPAPSPRSESPRFERPSAPSGRSGGGEMRGGGGSTPRSEGGGSIGRSGGGRGRER